MTDCNTARPGYALQLINLGRLLENPRLIKDLPPKDWIDPALYDLVTFLAGDATTDEKDAKIETALSKIAYVVWRLTKTDRLTAMTDRQKRNAMCARLAAGTLEAHEHLQNGTASCDEMESIVYDLCAIVKGTAGPAEEKREE